MHTYTQNQQQQVRSYLRGVKIYLSLIFLLHAERRLGSRHPRVVTTNQGGAACGEDGIIALTPPSEDCGNIFVNLTVNRRSESVDVAQKVFYQRNRLRKRLVW